MQLIGRYDAELLVAQGMATCENGELSRGNNNQKVAERSDQETARTSQQSAKGRRRLVRVKKDDQSNNASSTANGHASPKTFERSLRPTRSRKVASPVDSEGSTSGMQLRNRKTLEVASRLGQEETDSKIPKSSDKVECSKVDCCDSYALVQDAVDESGPKTTCLESEPKPEVADEHKECPTAPSETTESPVSLSPPSGGRLKLTLRMKRSPVLDEVIESGSSMASKSGRVSRHHKNVPIYEVLRVEGLVIDSDTTSQVETISSRKSQRRKRLIASSSPRPEVSSTTKRLRLIFGNESHTIDLPAQVSET